MKEASVTLRLHTSYTRGFETTLSWTILSRGCDALQGPTKYISVMVSKFQGQASCDIEPDFGPSRPLTCLHMDWTACLTGTHK